MSRTIEELSALAGKSIAACFNDCGVVAQDLKDLKFVVTLDPGIVIVEVQERSGNHNVICREDILMPNSV